MYKITANEPEELGGEIKGQTLRGLFRCTLRKSPEDAPSVIHRLQTSEAELIEALRRPTSNELERQIRHAVMPLFAGLISK